MRPALFWAITHQVGNSVPTFRNNLLGARKVVPKRRYGIEEWTSHLLHVGSLKSGETGNVHVL